MAKKLSKSTIDLLVKKLEKKLEDLYTADTPEIKELIKEHKIQCGERVKEIINSVTLESILDLMYASRNLYHAKMIYSEDFVKKLKSLKNGPRDLINLIELCPKNCMEMQLMN